MFKTENGYAKMYKVYGRTETEVKERLHDVLKRGGAAVVYTRRRAKEIQVLIETKEDDEDTARELMRPIRRDVKHALGDWYYTSRENETMEEAVVRLLVKHGLTVTTAESCTGGMTAAKIVNVSGASEVFNEGYITYSNKAKKKLLGVNKQTLKKYGAVSEQTAAEMALGGAKAAEADVCVAITGIAGPDGGTDEKPVGLVYIGCSVHGDVTVEKHLFHGTRAENREQAAVSALDLLRRQVLKNYR